jgi:hypothetical protein
MDVFGGILIFAVALAIYFLPSIIGKNKRNAGAIFALNLLLGWTLIGWVVSLVWALMVEAPDQSVVVPPANIVPQVWSCQNCKAMVDRSNHFCAVCGARVNWPAT